MSPLQARLGALALFVGGSLPAATPPSEPANPINSGGFWVGQSEPGTPCYAESIELTSGFREWKMIVRGVVTVSPAGGGQAKIYADWLTPTGERLREIAFADADGVAHFTHTGPPGRYQLTIVQILKVRFRYDPARGQAQAAIAPEDPQPARGV